MFALTRDVVEPFSDRQIELATTFADQAVIAIENVRLFDEVQRRTEELTKSLQQQTATAEVLEVISRSRFDLQPVFETVAESSVRLCGADRAFIFRFDGELLRMAAAYNAPPEFKEWVKQHPIWPGRHSGQPAPHSNAVLSTFQMSWPTRNIRMGRKTPRQFGPSLVYRS